MCRRQVSARLCSPRASASRRKRLQNQMQEPAEPDAFAFAAGPTRFMPSFQSPSPISGRPWAPYGEAAVDGARAMFEERRFRLGNARLEIGDALPFGERIAFEEGNVFVEDGHVAGGFDEAADRIRQPEQIV